MAGKKSRGKLSGAALAEFLEKHPKDPATGKFIRKGASGAKPTARELLGASSPGKAPATSPATKSSASDTKRATADQLNRMIDAPEPGDEQRLARALNNIPLPQIKAMADARGLVLPGQTKADKIDAFVKQTVRGKLTSRALFPDMESPNAPAGPTVQADFGRAPKEPRGDSKPYRRRPRSQKQLDALYGPSVTQSLFPSMDSPTVKSGSVAKAKRDALRQHRQANADPSAALDKAFADGTMGTRIDDTVAQLTAATNRETARGWLTGLNAADLKAVADKLGLRGAARPSKKADLADAIVEATAGAREDSQAIFAGSQRNGQGDRSSARALLGGGAAPKGGSTVNLGQLAAQLRSTASSADAHQAIAGLKVDELRALAKALGVVGSFPTRQAWRDEIVYKAVVGPRTLARAQGDSEPKARSLLGSPPKVESSPGAGTSQTLTPARSLFANGRPTRLPNVGEILAHGGGTIERLPDVEGRRRYKATTADGAVLTRQHSFDSPLDALDLAMSAMDLHDLDKDRADKDRNSKWRKDLESVSGSFSYASRDIAGFDAATPAEQAAIRRALGHWVGKKSNVVALDERGPASDPDQTRVAEPMVNAAIRGAITMTPSLQEDIAAMDQAMRLSKTARAFTAYRGYSNGLHILPADWQTRDLTGHEWSVPQFSAVTGDKEIAEGYAQSGAGTASAGFGIVMKVPKGAAAVAFMDDVGGLDNEGEIVLPRDMSFRVVKDRGAKGGVRWLEVEAIPAGRSPAPAGRKRARDLLSPKPDSARLIDQFERLRTDLPDDAREQVRNALANLGHTELDAIAVWAQQRALEAGRPNAVAGTLAQKRATLEHLIIGARMTSRIVMDRR